MRFDKLLVFLCLGLWPGLGAEALSGARAGDDATSLVDVTQGSFYDGWGREAVRTLTSYYSGGSEGAVQMLDYRASFLPVLDWAEGRIETEVGGDLYGFYASGGGAGRVQYEEDPAYAFTYQARYQEPAGRLGESSSFTRSGSDHLSTGTRIDGQSYASADDSMGSFYRFQGQEQEVFPLAKLGIGDSALAQWLDQLQLYHFPWRDYAAGLAAFSQTDPVPRDDSLYAALGANPVNYTDETGGMFEPPTSILQNIEPERERLLGLVVSDQSATINRAESEMLYDLLTRVHDEISVFRDQIRDTGDRLLNRLRLEIDRQMLDAGVTFTSDLADQIRVLRHPDIKGLREEWFSFNRDSQRWLRAFEAVQQRWFDRYEQPIMNLGLTHLREDEDVSDDQKDDEKADVNENDELLSMMPLTGTQNDIVADPDSDDGVMVGFPTQDGVLNSDQDQAPAHVDPNNGLHDGGRTIAPARAPQEENDRARPCCNIL